MNPRFSEHHENDPTPSREVAQRYRAALDDPDSDEGLGLLHYRGGEEEFLIGQEYCRSNDPKDRVTGVRILSQLGWGDQTFREESIQILLKMLGDDDPEVMSSAAFALGHRSAESAIPALVRLADHPDSEVRYGVVFGLKGQEDQQAVDALMKLATDEDRDVRNWAVFELGCLVDADSPEIRELFKNTMRDPDHEIRGEALVGLARRKDPTTIPELLYEWRDDDVSFLSLEAAEELAAPCLYNRLMQFKEILPLDNPHCAAKLNDAITACRPKSM